MTMHLILSLIATEVAKEHLTWWQESTKMITSPAHWLSEGIIEIGLGVIGLHAISKIVHHAKSWIVKGVKKCIRGLTGLVKRARIGA